MNRSLSLYQRHRFPGEIISYCIWLYYRFSLSYRGQTIAEELRRR